MPLAPKLTLKFRDKLATGASILLILAVTAMAPSVTRRSNAS